MEAIGGRKTLEQIAADHSVHSIQASHWRKQLLEGASELFGAKKKSKVKNDSQVKESEPFQQIVRLQMELEWLNLSSCDAPFPRKSIDHDDLKLSLNQQHELLAGLIQSAQRILVEAPVAPPPASP